MAFLLLNAWLSRRTNEASLPGLARLCTTPLAAGIPESNLPSCALWAVGAMNQVVLGKRLKVGYTIGVGDIDSNAVVH